tara:strand:- start:3744 stop:4391 length:648 start_codon:yes stop_codon:yes gene_type:complete
MANKVTFKTLLKRKISSNAVVMKVEEAREWYRETAFRMQQLKGVSSQKILRIGRENQRMKPTLRGRIMLGRMFMFEYEAKHADTLPYYDEFPLVFPIEAHADGFLAINLHYLPYTWRAVLMDSLYDLKVDPKNESDPPKLQLGSNGYNILKKSAKYRYFKPCIKKYLFEQVRSRYMEVPEEEWEIALFLPLERFVGENKRRIWIDTKKEYYRGRK